YPRGRPRLSARWPLHSMRGPSGSRAAVAARAADGSSTQPPSSTFGRSATYSRTRAWKGTPPERVTGGEGSVPRAGTRAGEPIDDAHGLLLLRAPEMVGRVELEEGCGTPTLRRIHVRGEGGIVHVLQRIQEDPAEPLLQFGSGEWLLISARLLGGPVRLRGGAGGSENRRAALAVLAGAPGCPRALLR